MPNSLVKPLALAAGGLLVEQWLFSNVIHIPGEGFGALVVVGCVLWLGREASKPCFVAPVSIDVWIERCQTVLNQFELFEANPSATALRRQDLKNIVERSGPQRIAFVSFNQSDVSNHTSLQQSLAGSASLELSFCHPLVCIDGKRCWPVVLQNQDAILFSLSSPLTASEFLWLQEVPVTQPAWILVGACFGQSTEQTTAQIKTDLPERWRNRIIVQSHYESLRTSLAPLRRALKYGLPDTRQRLLEDLHRRWQADLEFYRRARFQQLQQRTQWVVAGSVFASPLLSLDLLALVVANGLMMKEMKEIWGTDIKLDALQEAASQLVKAALAQGVVEWASQTLLSLAKLDAGSWLAAGVMQSLSAAYLTRVVGRSMADWLAINAGVSEPDLKLLKLEAPLLIARAAEKERLNWSKFLQQSRQWALNTTS
ncbi:YcjF family protein [Synechococcus sp. M16CYN]